MNSSFNVVQANTVQAKETCGRIGFCESSQKRKLEFFQQKKFYLTCLLNLSFVTFC